ncbi:HD domain-containing protein [bacterium]|nr:HD domain-containing protein [bacterium]
MRKEFNKVFFSYFSEKQLGKIIKFVSDYLDFDGAFLWRIKNGNISCNLIFQKENDLLNLEKSINELINQGKVKFNLEDIDFSPIYIENLKRKKGEWRTEYLKNGFNYFLIFPAFKEKNYILVELIGKKDFSKEKEDFISEITPFFIFYLFSFLYVEELNEKIELLDSLKARSEISLIDFYNELIEKIAYIYNYEEFFTQIVFLCYKYCKFDLCSLLIYSPGIKVLNTYTTSPVSEKLHKKIKEKLIKDFENATGEKIDTTEILERIIEFKREKNKEIKDIAFSLNIPIQTKRSEIIGFLFLATDRSVSEESCNIGIINSFIQTVPFIFEGIQSDIEKEHKMLRNIFEHTNDGIFYLDKSGGIIVVNSSGKKIYKEITGKKLERKIEKIGDIEITNREGSEIIEVNGKNYEMLVQRIFQKSNEYIFLHIRDITEIIKSKEKVENILLETVEALMKTIEMKDPYTVGHQRNVAKLVKAICEELGFDENKVKWMYVAGLIHDIGKIRVPSEILVKPGELSEEEFNIVREHPKAGYDILKHIDFPCPVPEIIYQHHERLDGSGYPRGLKNGEILFEARILAVADVVDAISSFRPYRPPLGIDFALSHIQENKGKLYDEKVVDVVLKLFKEKGFQF